MREERISPLHCSFLLQNDPRRMKINQSNTRQNICIFFFFLQRLVSVWWNAIMEFFLFSWASSLMGHFESKSINIEANYMIKKNTIIIIIFLWDQSRNNSGGIFLSEDYNFWLFFCPNFITEIVDQFRKKSDWIVWIEELKLAQWTFSLSLPLSPLAYQPV